MLRVGSVVPGACAVAILWRLYGDEDGPLRISSNLSLRYSHGLDERSAGNADAAERKRKELEMEWPKLRSEILVTTLLWLIAVLSCFVFFFFYDSRSSVGEVFSFAATSLALASPLVLPHLVYHLKIWRRILLHLCLLTIFTLPLFALAWFNLPVWQIPVFQGGWSILCGMFMYVYLVLIAAQILGSRWLMRRQAGSPA